MLTVRDGIVAATLSLSSGADEAVEQARVSRDDEARVLLFGASDLLLISRTPDFTAGPIPLSGAARAANWYYALSIRSLREDNVARPFRGLSFLRLHRPRFDRLSLARLEEILSEFDRICRDDNVTAEVLLGYGWADLYLDLRATSLRDFFKAVAASRALTIDGSAVFRNAFTIVGVDLAATEHAERSQEPVLPSIALRIAPSALEHSLEVLRRTFNGDAGDRWNVEITTGKRDVVVAARSPIPFDEFWAIHSRLRTVIGAPDSFVEKVETHLQFPPKTILRNSPVAAPPLPERCKCAHCGHGLYESFKASLTSCDDSIGPGLKQSFDGLAHLYRETLTDRDSCCDFDAAAAHFYTQRALLDRYTELTAYVRTAAAGFGSEVARVRRRLELYREAFDRLDISSMVIFQQEQNGSYSDLLTRSERVSLFRGGMQKLKTVLLAAIDAIMARNRLDLSLMVCWWPAGQIQSERPIGVIKVPVFFLHRPEIALFLIVHELGQLAAYEYLRDLPPAPMEETIEFTDADRALLRGQKISLDAPALPTPEVHLSQLESASRDTGTTLTDVFADLFLLRTGFGDDFGELRMFLFEQFLRLEQVIDADASRGGLAYSVFLYMRLMAISIASARLAMEDERKRLTAVTDAEIEEAAASAIAFVDAALRPGRFTALLANRSGLAATLQGEKVIAVARRQVTSYRRWIVTAIAFAGTISPSSSDAQLAGMDAIERGQVTEIDSTRISDYYRRLIDVPEDDPGLFKARAALTASILTSCEPRRRLLALYGADGLATESAVLD